MDIAKIKASEIPSMIESKKISATEVFEHYKQAIESSNPSLNAMLWSNPKAIDKAREIDKGAFNGGRMRGVPVLVKDNFCVQGMKATAASRILENFEPPYTAHCIQRLEDEGAIILGKANLDEFAMGSSNENSYFGPCKNPWNTEFVPGGSSGGSAAAVAAGMSPISVGSDTGGSIRQPASFCGVVGIKPTYGSVSRYGMIAFASSLDQAGTFGRSVEEAAFALDFMVHRDHKDSTNVEVPYDSLGPKASRDLKNTKVGLPKEYLQANLQPEMKLKIDNLVSNLESQGCEIVDVSLAHTDYAIPVYYLVAASEASSNLSRYDGVRYGLRDIKKDGGQPVADLKEFYKLTRERGFGDEVKRRILLGAFSLSAGYFDEFYTKACQVRRLIANDFVSAFSKCDFIIGPVTTETAFPIGSKSKDPVAMYYNDIFTTPANLAGLPSMSLPLGLDNQKLPFGLQIIAPSFKDNDMIAFANSLEEIIDFKGGADEK